MSRLLMLACSFGLLLAMTATYAGEGRWSGWLGPDRNGWVEGFQPPSAWPEKLNQRWSVTVGTGYGSPLVSGSHVFLHTRVSGNEVVSCRDLKTGDVVWTKEYAVPFKAAGGGEWHGEGPKSSPILADGRLFTMSITGDMSAWNAESGELLWRSSYGEKFKQNHPNWGVSTSPIVDDSRVIAHFGNDETGLLVALDVETGKQLWSQGKDGPSYSSPLLAEIDGVRQVIEWNHEALVGVESKSGRLLWTYPFPHLTHNQNMPTPTIHHGKILLGGENRGVVGLQPRRQSGKWSVEELWYQKKVALDMSSAVMNGDFLYGFSHYGKGRLFCLDSKSGDVLWQGPGRTGQNAAFLSIPQHVVVLLDRGEVQIIKATGDGYNKVASYKVSEQPTWSPPVLLEDGILIKDRESLLFWSFQ